jgi:hypothetical protein
MKLVVVIATKRHGELIADLSAQRLGLRKFQMMRIARCSLADQARLGCDKNAMGLAAAANLLAAWRHHDRPG